jgi:hypothetical protein
VGGDHLHDPPPFLVARGTDAAGVKQLRLLAAQTLLGFLGAHSKNISKLSDERNI